MSRSLLVVCVLASSAHADYTYSVESPVRSITNNGGETQSTVVPPKVKAQCPNGRFFVTNDLNRPPGPTSLIGRDLTTGATTDIHPTFDAAPDPSNLTWGTNDHDIVTLANGDVLLIWGVHSKAPLSPKPGWFDHTYHGSFGPGVRRGMMVWRSTDCGQTFQYRSWIDPAAVGDGTCANPQPASATSGVPAGTAAQPNYSNGGPDGQLAHVNTAGDTTYMMMPCVGYKQDKSKPGYILSADHVNELYVLRSTDGGGSWTTLGKLPTTAWRYGVASLENENLAFARYNDLSFATKQANGTYVMPTTEQPVPGTLGWTGFTAPTSMHDNVWSTTVVARVGSSKNVVIAYPSAIKDASNKTSFGYELYFYDRTANAFSSAPAILPLTHGTQSFLMHLAIVEAPTGPALLYWYDVNTSTNKVRIRGRFVFAEDQTSDDFDVALDAANTPHSFTITPGSNHWFGDYKTAGGYAWKGITPVNTRIYHYYPMWDEPDGTMKFAHVSVESTLKISVGFKKIDLVLPTKPKIGPPPVEMKRGLTATEKAFVERTEREVAH